MDTETIDRLFLELSQVTSATTSKELALLALLRRCEPHIGREPESHYEADEQRMLRKQILAVLTNRA